MGKRHVSGEERCQDWCVHLEAVSHARELLEHDEVYGDLAALFGALADPTRAKIVHILVHQELCTCDLAAAIGITESGISQHLRVLRSLRLVKSRRMGKFVYYSLDDAHVTMLVEVGISHQRDSEPPALRGDRAERSQAVG